MLTLKNIVKEYVVGDVEIPALKGVDLNFRSNEFVSILGPSGCGKTTLLNIIGGLDHYTSGDLVIKGRSTKKFNDRDWDTYRNHSIGFVFQNYNLIPHQSVLANVELALTLSGVSKAERRERAKEALVKVGLGDQLNKRPSQMSGGQMQRVAIARALVNNPEILLADEPTGALDSETSVQIMELLKQIAKDRLVIMVTHNPDLADEYSTRIIRLLDGKVVDDTNPCEPQFSEVTEEIVAKKKDKPKKDKKSRTSMSFFVALSLSFNNLMTKKTRTLLTSFAGSIGIIGIALILSLSTGINAFISQVQEDTLSAYPLTIERYTQDMSALLSAMTNVSDGKDYSDSNQIHVDDSLGTMMAAMSSTVENNLVKFKEYIDNNYDEVKDLVSDVQYTYDYDLQIYTEDGKNKVGMETLFQYMGEAFSGMSEMMEMGGGVDVFTQMIGNQEILDQQYDVIAGNWPAPTAPDEVVLVVDSNNQISKMTLYILGILDPKNIEDEMAALMSGNYVPSESQTYSYDYFLNLKFKLLTTSDFYAESMTKDDYEVNGKMYPVWDDIRTSLTYDQESFVSANGMDVKVVGIVRPKEGTAATSIGGAVGYTKALVDYVLDKNANTVVINQQKETPGVNVLTGRPFERTHYTPDNIQKLVKQIDSATMDIFYAYMTQQILTNPDFSDRIQVKDMQSFIGMYMLLPNENQADIFGSVLGAALADQNNKLAVDSIFGVVSQTTNKIVVTSDNVVTLLPVLDVSSVMTAFAGINGLTDIAGESMNAIYAKIAADHPELGTVGADNFMQVVMMLPDDYKSVIIADTVNAAVTADKAQVETLCMMLSAMSGGAEINADNLLLAIPSLDMQGTALMLSGVSGLIDIAGAESMAKIYSALEETIKNMTVNEEIFLTLLSTLTADDPAFIQLEETLYSMAPQVDATYDSVLLELDDAERASPDAINFFAKDFESKEKIEKFIEKYNNSVEETDKLEYSDIVGTLMSSVTIIVNAISYVLIAFVAISLVVSSIMIGIITNISVLERTKEIGILRAIGASKKDISRVFNAETITVGFVAGALGILITLFFNVIINIILNALTGLPNLKAVLPVDGAIILVAISMFLTFIAGLIPAGIAAKKDPVIALRSE